MRLWEDKREMLHLTGVCLFRSGKCQDHAGNKTRRGMRVTFDLVRLARLLVFPREFNYSRNDEYGSL